jgi:hypothetical protein
LQRLVLLDTDRIKRYVFATGRLSEIRGASLLLDELNRGETPKQFPPNGCFYAAGGQALGVAPDEDAADAIIERVQALYLERTGVASVTGIHARYEASHFSRCLQEALIQMAEAKRARASHLGGTHALTRPCQLCGVHPVVKHRKLHDDEQRWVCDGCDKKLDRNAQFVRESRSPHHTAGLWGGFTSYARQHDAAVWPEDVEPPADLSEIGTHIAVIYADGNNIGRRLVGIDRSRDYATFAERLDTSTRNAVYGAVARHLTPRRRDGSRLVAPFQFILIGGDDVLIVVPAEGSLELARDICETFQRDTNPTDDGCSDTGGFSMSAGVTIASHSFPFGYLVDTAEQLLKNAKKHGAMRQIERRRTASGGTGDSTPAMIDFAVLTGSSAVDVDVARSAMELGKESEGGRVVLTRRPYSVVELESLTNVARALRNKRFSTSHLRQMGDAVVASKNRAIIHSMVLRARSRTAGPLDDLQSAFELTRFPWRMRTEGSMVVYDTPVLDLIEAYDYLG